MQPGSFDFDGNLARFLARRHEDAFFGQMKQAKELNEIALDKAQITQIIEFVFGKPKLAQIVDFATDFFDIRLQIYALGAALEPVFDLCAREMVQYHLHHAELVQIGIE